MRRLFSLRVVAAGLLALLAGLAARPAQAQDPSFYVANRSGTTINEVYVSSANDSGWGQDLLGSNVLSSGSRLAVRPRGCVNDIRVVYANGRAEERRRVNTCNLNEVAFGGGGGGSPAAGTNPDFRIVNRSNRTINEIYVSASTNNNWGRDWLGSNTLAPGRFWTITPREGTCVHDIRVVFNDGNAQERRRVNTCNLTDVTFP
jgi:hypothetical protein